MSGSPSATRRSAAFVPLVLQIRCLDDAAITSHHGAPTGQSSVCRVFLMRETALVEPPCSRSLVFGLSSLLSFRIPRGCRNLTAALCKGKNSYGVGSAPRASGKSANWSAALAFMNRWHRFAAAPRRPIETAPGVRSAGSTCRRRRQPAPVRR
jgi:hypothetical protein